MSQDAERVRESQRVRVSPEIARSMIDLRRQGLTLREIAEKVGVSLITVWSHTSSAFPPKARAGVAAGLPTMVCETDLFARRGRRRSDPRRCPSLDSL